MTTEDYERIGGEVVTLTRTGATAFRWQAGRMKGYVEKVEYGGKVQWFAQRNDGRRVVRGSRRRAIEAAMAAKEARG